MSRIERFALIAVVAAGLAYAPRPVAAQEGTAAAASGEAVAPTRPRDIQLVFEREVFSYAASSRRDPFRSLADQDGIGPLFDDLKLRMIIHSDQAGQSVALVVDGSKKVYRLRKGDVVGNATVLDITQERVTFTVEDFGNRRQEVLDLKAQNQQEGA
jgi:Tfp pilus assembly protein PilP